MSHDAHSFAKPEEAVVRHLSLNLNVDFDNKQLSGEATLTIETTGNAEPAKSWMQSVCFAILSSTESIFY